MTSEKTIWLVAGLRTPFVGVDGPFAHRDSLAMSVPVVQAMATLASGPTDFAVWEQSLAILPMQTLPAKSG